jgi:hypothetical protein
MSNFKPGDASRQYFATVRKMDPSPSLLRTIQKLEDDLDGWTHTLATLREINAGMPFAHPIAEVVDE